MHASSPPRHLQPPGRSLVAFGVGVVLLAGCAEPERPTDVEPDPVVTEDPIEEPDDRDELVAQVAVLRATLVEIQEALTEVAEASSVGEMQPGVDRALAELVVERNGVPSAAGSDQAAALLPSQTLDRSESATSPDLLSATTTIAGDVGGELGRDIAEVLRDPIAGDLGAWQRDPAGMVGLAESVATSSTDLAALETAIRELEGEGTRALAWAFVAEEAAAADDLELARGAAERALAHVQIMLLAVEDVGGSS